MKKISLCIACLALILVGQNCKKSHNDTPNTSLNDNDRQFLVNASYSNLAEVDAGNLASYMGTNAGVKIFGQMMSDDHGAAESELRTIADSVQVSIPSTPDSAHISMKAMLKNLTGMAFDTTYISAQITDHQNAIALFQMEINSGRSPRIKTYASTYLPKIQMHLMMADSLKTILKTP
ncbi:MAG: DUF4142 domain-containing protein [Bacteroidetes bacterium]|nr:DUF4142 domain-containing protein [Bacteroidota bacterium]